MYRHGRLSRYPQRACSPGVYTDGDGQPFHLRDAARLHPLIPLGGGLLPLEPHPKILGVPFESHFHFHKLPTMWKIWRLSPESPPVAPRGANRKRPSLQPTRLSYTSFSATPPQSGSPMHPPLCLLLSLPPLRLVVGEAQVADSPGGDGHGKDK